MTVKELIEKLNEFDSDLEVAVECDDCEDKWYDIDSDESEVVDNTLLLRVFY